MKMFVKMLFLYRKLKRCAVGQNLKLKRYAAVENSKDKKQTTQKIKRGRKLKKYATAAVAAPSQSPSPTPSSTDECRLCKFGDLVIKGNFVKINSKCP